MFTSEPSLAWRIGRMIAESPVVDPLSRIRPDRPGVSSLAELLDDHRLKAELHAVGMVPGDMDPDLDADERVRRAIPHLRRIRNTASAWCFDRILRDLYDFADPHLDRSNVDALAGRVAAQAADPGWAESLLRDRLNIRAIAGIAPEGVASTSIGTIPFVRRVALDFRPDERPATAARLARAVHVRLETTPRDESDRFVAVASASALGRVDRGEVDRVLSGASHGRKSGDATISRFILKVAAAWHHEQGRTIQLAVGLGWKGSPERWAARLARLAIHYEDAGFDLVGGPEGLAPKAARLAGRLPNVFATGCAWPDFAPSAIERTVGHALQVAPMTKLCAFGSDAATAEWTYGRFQLAKKAIASALAGWVEAGFAEEAEVPPLLRQVLHDTPRDLLALPIVG